ncbi:MAG: hypothetical protein ABIN97_06040, partial [Ginsengibacter sp.]
MTLSKKRRNRLILLLVIILIAILSLLFFRRLSKRPSVTAVSPENNSQSISENSSISSSILKLPNGGIKNSTINSKTVYLTEKATGAIVPSNVNGTGGGDAIILVPASPLKL